MLLLPQGALDLLRRVSRARHGFAIEEIDVDSDPDLAAAHGLSVPVVAFDGKVRFKGVVNPVLLDRLIAAESARVNPRRDRAPRGPNLEGQGA